MFFLILVVCFAHRRHASNGLCCLQDFYWPVVLAPYMVLRNTSVKQLIFFLCPLLFSFLELFRLRSHSSIILNLNFIFVQILQVSIFPWACTSGIKWVHNCSDILITKYIIFFVYRSDVFNSSILFFSFMLLFIGKFFFFIYHYLHYILALVNLYSVTLFVFNVCTRECIFRFSLGTVLFHFFAAIFITSLSQ